MKMPKMAKYRDMGAEKFFLQVKSQISVSFRHLITRRLEQVSRYFFRWKKSEKKKIRQLQISTKEITNID